MSLLGRLMGRPPVGPSAAAVPEGASNAEQQPPAVALTDIESLLPGRCITLRVIEDFFRRQFAACLRQANLGQHLESCLVFGPDTWADLRRLLLPAAGGAGAGPQGFPALERFCREHDLASKQYLLLPLLTPSHGSLLIFCQPAKQQAAGEMAGSAAPPSDRQHPLILHLDSLSGALCSQPSCGCCPCRSAQPATCTPHTPTWRVDVLPELMVWLRAQRSLPTAHALCCLVPTAHALCCLSDLRQLLGSDVAWAPPLPCCPAGHSSFERHQPDCYALHRFLQPYRSKDGRAAQPEMITAGVSANGTSVLAGTASLHTCSSLRQLPCD
jgi:hypothetical protein